MAPLAGLFELLFPVVLASAVPLGLLLADSGLLSCKGKNNGFNFSEYHAKSY